MPQTWQPANEAEQVVFDLVEGWTDLESQRQTFKNHLADDVEWWNGGWPVIHGRDVALTLLDFFADLIGMAEARIEVKNVASRGNVVFTERVDRLYRADGTLISEPPIVGIFEIENGKVARWREYEDPRHLFPGGRYTEGPEAFLEGMLSTAS